MNATILGRKKKTQVKQKFEIEKREKELQGVLSRPIR